MRIEIGKITRNFVILVAILVTMMPGVLALTPAVPPEPSYMEDSSEGIDVDGDFSEWSSPDFFANMNQAGPFHGNSDPDLLSKLYLRYDCTNGILYAMVLLNDSSNHVINVTESEKLFVKVNETDEIEFVNNGLELVNGNTNYDGIAPDLCYIIDASGAKVGWEASTPLAVGSYRLCVRTQVDTQSEVDIPSATGNYQTGIPLEIKCSPYTPIPEFPTIALPVMAILGLMFIFGRKREL